MFKLAHKSVGQLAWAQRSQLNVVIECNQLAGHLELALQTIFGCTRSLLPQASPGLLHLQEREGPPQDVGSEEARYCFCLILLVKTNHEGSPDSRSKDTDSSLAQFSFMFFFFLCSLDTACLTLAL